MKTKTEQTLGQYLAATKTKTEHTPGPWKVEPAMKGQNCGYRIHTGESAPYGMAHIYSPGHCPEANAHLIAAAPDLLAALEAIDECDWPQIGELHLRALSKARAAIAKAKGE